MIPIRLGRTAALQCIVRRTWFAVQYTHQWPPTLVIEETPLAVTSEAASSQVVSSVTETAAAAGDVKPQRRWNRVWLVLLALLTLSLALVVCCPMNRVGGNISEEWFVGFLLGIPYGHVFLAAGWAVFGPGKRRLRWLGSPCWVGVVSASLVAHLVWNNHPTSQAGVISFGLVTQWIVTLAVMGLAVLITRIRLVPVVRSETQTASARDTVQFGIRDILVLISLSAICLAVGRQVLPHINWRGEWAAFAFLAVAAALIPLPIGFSIPLRSKAWLAIAASLGWTVLGTWLEIGALQELGNIGPNMLHLIAINVFSVLLIVLGTLCLRRAGYRLQFK